jgi:polysaccharide biosynthesis transport protein
MTFSDFLVVFRARWKAAALVFLAVVCAALAGSLLMPKSYTATASVLIDLKPDPVSGVFLHNGMTGSSYMATQADLVASERVARRAISALGLERNEVLRQEWREDTQGATEFGAWLAAHLAKKLDVRPSRDSSVLSVAYTSGDASFSAAVANAYVSAYVSTILDLKTEPARNLSAYYDERAQSLRSQFESAQNRLSEYQRANGIIAADERLDVENMRLAEISSQVVIMEAAAMEASSRMGQAGSSPDRMQEVLSNPVVTGLQAELSRQEVKLEELRARLGEANPQVMEASGAVEGVRAKLQAAVQRASGSVSITSNVAQQRLAQLRIARDQQRAKVLKMRGNRDELDVLRRDVENAQRAYDAVVSRGGQALLESKVTQTNVSIVKDATPPTDPSSPKIFINMALALFLGTLLAIGTAILREFFDPRLRTARDITQSLKTQLLVVMPNPPEPRRQSHESNDSALRRMSGERLPTVAAR